MYGEYVLLRDNNAHRDEHLSAQELLVGLQNIIPTT